MADNIHTGHRRRMKQEFLVRGLEGMPDHRVLELLLFFSIPQGDVNPLAHRLIDRFGSLAGVLNASRDQLTAVKGVGENTAALIRLIPALSKRYIQSQADLSGIYKESWEFRGLLEPEFFGARNELVYLLCLDAKHKLLSVNKLGEGEPDTVSISTRKVMETALGANATKVVLAHNHPGGLAFPSTDDIVTTQQLARSLYQVNVELHDHLVFGDGDMVSMLESGYLAGVQRGR